MGQHVTMHVKSTEDTGATYSGNAFENCAVRNSDLAGGERAAGANDITASFDWTVSYKPRINSPLLNSATNLGWKRDITGVLGKNYAGAYSTITTGNERGVR